MFYDLIVSFHINKNGKKESHGIPRMPGSQKTGIFLNIQLVNFDNVIRKCSPHYILYKYVKPHLMHRHLSSYKGSKQMM
jgi:hypothetical protein